MNQDMFRASIAKAIPWTLAVIWSALLLAGLIQYLMPAGYRPPFGVNQPGVEFYKGALGIQSWMPLENSIFMLALRSLLVIAFVSYLCLLYFAHRTDYQMGWLVRIFAWIFILLYGLVIPAGLSCDVYGYLAYARMVTLHRLNPYYHTQFELSELHDPVSSFLQWDVVTPYGPFWTVLSVVLIAPIKSFPLELQVVFFKWLAGFSLMLIAHETSRLADRFSPGRGGLAFLAVISCPLFILEGPGNAHNDFVMVALLLLGLRLWHDGRFRMGALMIGLSAAVKFVPLAFMPWLIWMRRRELYGSPKGGSLWAALILMLLPVVLFAGLFASGGVPSEGLETQMNIMRRNSSDGYWQPLLLVAIYLALFAWVVWSDKADRVLIASVIFLLALLILVAKPPFPWYGVWALAIALTLWDRVGIRLLKVSILLSHTLLYGYVTIFRG